MSYSDEPLRFPGEVFAAVSTAGGSPDLAHGASLIADQRRFEPLFNDDSHQVTERSVFGVTVLSLTSAGEASLQTATFGFADNVPFTQVIEEEGGNRVTGLEYRVPIVGAIASRLAWAKRNLRAIANMAAEGADYHVVGGCVTTESAESASVDMHFFMSKTLAETLASGRARPSRAEASRLRVFSAVAARAVVNNTGPTNVERPFKAVI